MNENVRERAPDAAWLPGIAAFTSALISDPWCDRRTGTNPNNSPSMRCVITPVVEDHDTVQVDRVEYDHESCTDIENASLHGFPSM